MPESARIAHANFLATFCLPALPRLAPSRKTLRDFGQTSAQAEQLKAAVASLQAEKAHLQQQLQVVRAPAVAVAVVAALLIHQLDVPTCCNKGPPGEQQHAPSARKVV